MIIPSQGDGSADWPKKLVCIVPAVGRPGSRPRAGTSVVWEPGYYGECSDVQCGRYATYSYYRSQWYVNITVLFGVLRKCLLLQEWWTHLWLNEGFASWIEYLCVDHCFPEYDIWTQFVSADYTRALDLDALDNSHPIEVCNRWVYLSHSTQISQCAPVLFVAFKSLCGLQEVLICTLFVCSAVSLTAFKFQTQI